MSNEKPRFEAEDFRSGKKLFGRELRYNGPEVVHNMDAAERANAWLDTREKEGWQLVNLKDAQVMYGEIMPSSGKFIWADDKTTHILACSHRALLINIEELPKEPCKHEPEGVFEIINCVANQYNKCKHCGKKLTAKWTVAE